MFRKIRPYMGSYIRYTYAALGAMFAGLIASAVPFAVALFNLLRMLSWKKKIKAFGELAREAEQEMLAARGSADKLDRQLQKEYDLLK